MDSSLPIPPSPPQLANLQPYSHSAGLSNGGGSTNIKLVAAVLLSTLLHAALVTLLINFGDLHLSSPNTTTPETTTLEIPLLPPGPTPPTPTPTPTATPKLATPTPQPTPLLTPSPLLVQSLPPEPAEPEELTLGLQDSPFTNTEVWQGFATNTSEQTARKGGVEQAALTPNPTPPPPTPATQPTPQEPTTSPQPETPTPAQPEPLQPEPQQPQPQQPEPQQTQPQQLNPPSPPTPAQPGLDATPTTTPPTPNELTLTPPIQPSPATPPQQLQPVQPNPQQPNPQQPNPQQPQPQQPNSPTPTPASTPNQPPPQPATQPTNTPPNTPNGAQAEPESEATSIREAVDIRPGRPAAAKGLQINTVRPRWSTTTQLTALPKNPVVTVTFGRSGRVIHADYLRGQNTGYKEVDGPLIDALYRWTAKGDRLNTLPPTPANQKETQGLTISFRIILRND